MKTFQTATALAAASLATGQYVETYGLATVDDGGAARYFVVAPVGPGVNDVTLANGNIAKFVMALVPVVIPAIPIASAITASTATSGLVGTDVQAQLDEIDSTVDKLNTLSGVAKDAINLGAFTGVTIPDDATNKSALQALETAVEAAALPVKWTSPQKLGTGLVISGAGVPALTSMGPFINNQQYVAYYDDLLEELRAYYWNGTIWTLDPSALSIPGAGTGVSICALSLPTVVNIAFIDGNNEQLRAYQFNGAFWTLLGSALSIPGIAYPSITALNSTDVAVIDSATDTLRTYRFNGLIWTLIGSALYISGVTPQVAITAMNSTDIAFADGGLDRIRTYRFDGTNWAAVGSQYTVLTMGTPVMASMSSTDILFIDSETDQLMVYRFNGSNWDVVEGAQLSLSCTSSALTMINGTDFAFIDSVGEELTLYRFGFSPNSTTPYRPF